MTDLTDESVKALLDGATPGRRVQFHGSYCPEAVGTPFSDWDTSHDVSVIRPDGSRYRLAHYKHASDAYLSQMAPDLARALLDARAELAATQTQVGDWIVRADEANVKVETLEAELARNKTLATENARIRAAQPDWLQNCVVCKRVVDTREQADGGDPHGSGDADGGWVCSIECAEVQHPSPPPADGWTWNERLGWIGPDGKPADPRRG